MSERDQGRCCAGLAATAEPGSTRDVVQAVAAFVDDLLDDAPPDGDGDREGEGDGDRDTESDRATCTEVEDPAPDEE